ncbi:hypothetical protein LCGC14_2727620 [marine sediment metagenome]|uniref:Glycosyl hydrolase family 98 putative carbohydrate-binding module domain-containing protein n=1 Tax=marine sediment metagenome TaxID=412755 RepID=A0A0F9BH95_9ZZZZ
MRVLHWHIEGVLYETGVIDTDVKGNAYRLDRDYRPIDTWVRAKRVPTGDLGIQIDINDDGTSIYRTEPVIPSGSQEITSNAFSAAVLLKDSVITLDVDRVGSGYSGKDLVIELYLDEE